MIPVTPDTEITLSCGNERAIISPWGASLRRYFFISPTGEETDIVWGYTGGGRKKGGQGDVLIPFAGRIADGRYQFEGESFELERNDKEGPNAIHGFVRTIPWTIYEADANRASFDIRLDAAAYERQGYPFSLSVRVTYVLEDATGLSCSFLVHNVGQKTAPLGVGFHPYFTVGTAVIDEAEVKIPGAAYLEFNERLVPTGRIVSVVGTEWDCRQYRPIASRRFNHCYVRVDRDADGTSTASLRNPKSGRTVDVQMDRAFTALVVYTGDAISEAPRAALAIEPMTCASDAFNHPEWGLKALTPGETLSGRYLIRHRIGPSR